MITTQIASGNIIKKLLANKLLAAMILAYTTLIFIVPELGGSAIGIAKDNILQLLMVMPIILAMTSLTKAWIPEELISEKLGKDSGFIGSLLALILGSVSAGPIYAAFPFAKALLDKGASLKNITILLSSWAVIKVPMLANELAFLGPKFMMTRWILTVISILILSILLEKAVSIDEITSTFSDDENSPTISTDDMNISELCTGCGVCLKIMPDNLKGAIQIKSGQAQMISDIGLTKSLYDQLRRACPRKAIS